MDFDTSINPHGCRPSGTASFLALCGASLAALLSLGAPLSGETWGGGTGNWTDDNWGLAGSYPGDAANGSAVAIRTGEVTLSTNLPFTVGSGFDRQFAVGSATLNIGANITSAAYTTIGSFTQATVNHTAGVFALGGRFDLGNQGSGGRSVYNLSGGTLDVNSEDFRFGYNATGSLSMNVSGTGNMKFRNMAFHQGALNISGGSVTSTGTLNMNAGEGTASIIAINGSNSKSVNFNRLNAFSSRGSATLRFTADANGFSFIDVKTLNLNSGTDSSILHLDLTNWDGVTGLVDGRLIFANYTTLIGTFSSVNIIGGSGILDYRFDQFDDGSLAVAVDIPEASAFALIVGCLGALMVLRRRVLN